MFNHKESSSSAQAHAPAPATTTSTHSRLGSSSSTSSSSSSSADCTALDLLAARWGDNADDVGDALALTLALSLHSPLGSSHQHQQQQQQQQQPTTPPPPIKNPFRLADLPDTSTIFQQQQQQQQQPTHLLPQSSPFLRAEAEKENTANVGSWIKNTALWKPPSTPPDPNETSSPTSFFRTLQTQPPPARFLSPLAMGSPLPDDASPPVSPISSGGCSAVAHNDVAAEANATTKRRLFDNDDDDDDDDDDRRSSKSEHSTTSYEDYSVSAKHHNNNNNIPRSPVPCPFCGRHLVEDEDSPRQQVQQQPQQQQQQKPPTPSSPTTVLPPSQHTYSFSPARAYRWPEDNSKAVIPTTTAATATATTIPIPSTATATIQPSPSTVSLTYHNNSTTPTSTSTSTSTSSPSPPYPKIHTLLRSPQRLDPPDFNRRLKRILTP